jgi:hypothetical protein
MINKTTRNISNTWWCRRNHMTTLVHVTSKQHRWHWTTWCIVDWLTVIDSRSSRLIEKHHQNDNIERMITSREQCIRGKRKQSLVVTTNHIVNDMKDSVNQTISHWNDNLDGWIHLCYITVVDKQHGKITWMCQHDIVCVSIRQTTR